MRVSPTELLGGGKKTIEYPAQGNPLQHSPLLWPAGPLGRRYRVRPYADLPASFQYLGNQGDMLFRDARASVSIKKISSEVTSPSTPKVKRLQIYKLARDAGMSMLDRARCL